MKIGKFPSIRTATLLEASKFPFFTRPPVVKILDTGSHGCLPSLKNEISIGTTITLVGSEAMSRSLENTILSRAYELIAEKRRWTRYAASRSATGRSMPFHSPAVVRYCAFAALAKAASETCGDPIIARHLVEKLEVLIMKSDGRSPGTRLAAINDCEGHRAIVKAFEKTFNALTTVV